MKLRLFLETQPRTSRQQTGLGAYHIFRWLKPPFSCQGRSASAVQQHQSARQTARSRNKRWRTPARFSTWTRTTTIYRQGCIRWLESIGSKYTCESGLDWVATVSKLNSWKYCNTQYERKGKTRTNLHWSRLVFDEVGLHSVAFRTTVLESVLSSRWNVFVKP